MDKRFGILASLLLTLPLPQVSLSESMTADDIMEKVDYATRKAYETQFSGVTITTCRYRIADGNVQCSERPRTVVANSVEKFGIGEGERATDRSLLLVHEPPSDRGSALLVYEYKKRGRDNDNWLYLPALDKVNRVISSEGRGGSVFGSEFSVETTENPEARKLHEYNYELIGETTLRERPVWIIEIVPTAEKADDIEYDKVVSWIDKETYLPLKENLHRDGGVHKQRNQFGIEKIDGIFVVTKVIMNNLTTSRISQMDYSGIRHNIQISDEFMTQRTLTDFAFRERNLARFQQDED